MPTDTSQWQLINSFAAWFSAAGSFTASALALYLARRREWVRLRVTCGTGASLLDQFTSSDPTAFFVGVVNHSLDAVHIKTVLWHHRVFRSRSCTIDPSDASESTTLPAILARGGMASFVWRIVDFVRESKDVITFLSERRFPRLSAKFLRIGVITTMGDITLVQPHRAFVSALLAECDKIREARRKA